MQSGSSSSGYQASSAPTHEVRSFEVSAANKYRSEQLLHLSPAEVIQKLYDVAIVSCKRGDWSLAHRALNELIVALNFDQKELSVGLFRLYDYCKVCIRNGNAGEAARVLEELRGAWAESFKL
jgi:flagellin-specific chaperone FliS